MVTAKQTAFRLREEDLALLEALMTKTGIASRTDVIRLAIRKLAEAEGIGVLRPKPKRSK